MPRSKQIIPRDESENAVYDLLARILSQFPGILEFPGCEALNLKPDSLEAGAIALAWSCAVARNHGNECERLEGILQGWHMVRAVNLDSLLPQQQYSSYTL